MKCLRCEKELALTAWWCPRCGLHRSGSGLLPTNYSTGPINGPLVGWPTKQETAARWRECRALFPSNSRRKLAVTVAVVAVLVSLALCALAFWFFNR